MTIVSPRGPRNGIATSRHSLVSPKPIRIVRFVEVRQFGQQTALHHVIDTIVQSSI